VVTKTDVFCSSLEQKKSKGKRQQTPKNAMKVDLAVNAEGNSH
jgi:nucleolar complex protein 2